MCKSVIVTGAAGFIGYSLTKALSLKGYKVFALVRPGSLHNARLVDLQGVEVIALDINEIALLKKKISERPLALIHLAWSGDRHNRNDFDIQRLNIDESLSIVRIANEVGCKRIMFAGSQAEYGITTAVQDENSPLKPFTAYGATKVAMCYLTKCYSQNYGLEWIWCRIFSLYGLYEASDSMLPMLIGKLKKNEQVMLSSCRQNWDYLHVADAADAMIELMERGRAGEIYNIANGKYRQLRDFVETVKEVMHSESVIIYGCNPDPFVSLQPSVDKIRNDTGWKPKIEFQQGIETYI